MARKQSTPSREEWKAALVEIVKEGDYLRTLVEQVVQQVLEAEMEEALGAEKGERTAEPSRIPQRSLFTDVSHAGGKTGTACTAGSARALPDGVV